MWSRFFNQSASLIKCKIFNKKKYSTEFKSKRWKETQGHTNIRNILRLSTKILRNTIVIEENRIRYDS